MSATAPMQRTEVVRLNNEIAKCSGRRDLAGAETLFAQLTASRAANSHSYSSMINAHVMCGDIIGAQRVFDQLRNEKRLRLDIVSCTSMLKGFSKIGDVSSSLTLLASMRTVQPKLVPNVRTLNTFLRACIVAGEPEEASTIFAQMTRDSKVAPDVSSWEYLVVLLSQQLAVSKILPILGRLKDDATMVSGLGLMAISLARACAILGDWKGCSKALGQARVFLDRNDAAESTAAAADSEAEEAEGRVVAGGKRAWRQGADTDSREQSLAVYRTHRTAELRQQVNVIADYALRASASGVDGATDSLFGRVFSFGTTTTSSSTDEVVSAVMRCRKVKFGLEAFSKRHDKCGDSKAGKSEPKNAIGKRKRDAVTPDEATEGRFALMESQLRSCFDSKSFLDLPRIFGTPSRPVKLEMGAGAGEWVVAQARSDPSACWVSLELRHDRVYETFTRAVFSGVSNLAVLGGNALELLPLRFAPCSLSHVFVNFPEPPQQTGHDFTTQSSHLLCNDFFVQTARVLTLGGEVTILTDNRWYAMYLLRYLAVSGPQLQLRSKVLKREKLVVFGEKGVFVCYEGTPGREAGHAVEASSYFDRMWTRSEQPKRFFVCLVKVAESSPSAALKSNKATVQISKSRKIKFD